MHENNHGRKKEENNFTYYKLITHEVVLIHVRKYMN